MKKKAFLFLISIVAIIFIFGLIYLNNVILPTQIKSLIINTLKEKTQKNVTLESLQFNIFKGLVLRDLAVYDEKEKLISLEEGHCSFFILPILKKRIAISNLKLKHLVVFLERRPDNTFNLLDLFPRKITQQETAAAKKDTGFSIFVYKVNLIDSNIHFQDKTFIPFFTKDLENLNLTANLSLPASVKFNLFTRIPSLTNKPVFLEGKGEYKITERKLATKIFVRDFPPKEFFNYYRDMGVIISDGLLDCLVDLEFKDATLYADIVGQNRNLSIAKERISVSLNSDIKASLLYNFKDKQIGFSGKAKIFGSKIQGLEFFDSINDIGGELFFNDTEISSNNLKANIWNIPLQTKIILNYFRSPQLDINVLSKLDLGLLPGILKDKFKFSFPGVIKGGGVLSLSIKSKIPAFQDLKINGYLDISDTVVKLEKMDAPIEAIRGRLEFSQNQLNWPELNFKYQDIPYKTVGTLTDFQAPSVQLGLQSSELSLESNFSINNKLIMLSKCAGQYRNSDFSFSGDINTKDPAQLQADIKGDLDIDLQDIKGALKKFGSQLEQTKPQGSLQANFTIKGNISDIKTCAIKAKFSSQALSVYGLKAKEFDLTYNQENGLGNIPLMHLSFYNGIIEASGMTDLREQNLPYWVTANIQGVKIEQLKLDTPVKEKDIAGKVSAQARLNGFSSDLSKLNGEGKIVISDGKLWQLNLFQGLGSLLFVRDFANIVFQEGTCDFLIKDKSIFTDNLVLKSGTTDLMGSAKIGFDSSLDVKLNVHILDEKVPLTGTFRDITTAIVGQGGLFGVIKINGTLKDPKYKFQTAVMSILKGLTDTLLGK